MTILGGLVGAIMLRLGVLKVLMLGAVMTVITNLPFIPAAQNPGNLSLLYVVIGADNITAGLAAPLPSLLIFRAGVQSLVYSDAIRHV